MASSLHRLSLTALTAAWLISASPASAAFPEYQLGDIATEDVITPVPLVVLNPEATEILKQNVAKQIPIVVRHDPRRAQEIETSLRNTISRARERFQNHLQASLSGRPPAASDLGSVAYTQAIAEAARDTPPDFPFDAFAPLWLEGKSDEPVINSLLRPIQEVMAQVIIDYKGEPPIPATQAVRLVTVRSLDEPPALRDLDNPAEPPRPVRMLSIWRARRLAETSFPEVQTPLAKFAATLILHNALADPKSTELLRTRRLDGIAANDTYAAAQTIVTRGQVIDRKALHALAALREKNLISTLQIRLEEQKKSAPPPPTGTNPLVWIAASLVAMFLLLLGILWRLRARPADTLVSVFGPPALGTGTDTPALSDGTPETIAWQQRALTAEASATRAHEAIRTGVLGWMKEKIVHTLFRQRSELLAVQQKAEAEMRELEERLEKLHAPLQERLDAYASRIEELENALAAKGETNRLLLSARLNAARQQMQAERNRFETN
jgi:hypothetical protein